jgi:hypothetical protein
MADIRPPLFGFSDLRTSGVNVASEKPESVNDKRRGYFLSPEPVNR